MAALADAMFSLHHDAYPANPDNYYTRQFQWGYTAWNSTGSLNDACEEHYGPDNAWMCFHGAVVCTCKCMFVCMRRDLCDFGVRDWRFHIPTPHVMQVQSQAGAEPNNEPPLLLFVVRGGRLRNLLQLYRCSSSIAALIPGSKMVFSDCPVLAMLR